MKEPVRLKISGSALDRSVNPRLDLASAHDELVYGLRRGVHIELVRLVLDVHEVVPGLQIALLGPYEVRRVAVELSDS
jgi:hypothetical protein